jgi:DNA-directed RNA polymerase specialized sigma24 family protein
LSDSKDSTARNTRADSAAFNKADEWRDFRDQFRALGEQGLSATCFNSSWEKVAWTLEGNASEGAKAAYKALATRAGIKLGAPEGFRPFEYWLEAVNRHKTIWDLCEDSATFCSHLELKELEQSELERQELQSRRADGQAQTAPEPPEATADTPMGFDGLGQKWMDLSRYFDAADLTERQRECASMRYEYRLSVTQIARRQGLHRKTVQESLHAGNKRLERDEKFKQALKRRAAHRSLHNESD